jgi:hypothetical protein
MSEVIKCKICEIKEEKYCQLMRVIIEESGKESKYCCEHLQREHLKKNISK